jgi:hypothetical protein
MNRLQTIDHSLPKQMCAHKYIMFLTARVHVPVTVPHVYRNSTALETSAHMSLMTAQGQQYA